jgi:hypothetical protein
MSSFHRYTVLKAHDDGSLEPLETHEVSLDVDPEDAVEAIGETLNYPFYCLIRDEQSGLLYGKCQLCELAGHE